MLLPSPEAAWLAAAASTALAWWESGRAAWAPFLTLYAILSPIPGLWAGTARFGPVGSAWGRHPAYATALALAILAWELGLMGFGYESFIGRRGQGTLARVSPRAAMEELLDSILRRHGPAIGNVRAWAAVYFLLWAPVAEELFFWGYLYPAWRPAYGTLATSLLVAAFFAARHGFHFLLAPRPYPWPAAIAMMISTGGAAILNGWLFETCGSLWLPIAVHLVSNLASLGSAPAKSAPDRA